MRSSEPGSVSDARRLTLVKCYPPKDNACPGLPPTRVRCCFNPCTGRETSSKGQRMQRGQAEPLQRLFCLGSLARGVA